MPDFQYAFLTAATPNNGLGYTLKTIDGRFFCGFKDRQGDVVYNGVKQTEMPVTGQIEPQFGPHESIYLHPYQMKQRDLKAIVYPAAPAAVIGMEYTEAAKLAKADETTIPEFVRLAITNKDTDSVATPGNNTQIGLATGQACQESRDNGFARLADSVKYGLHRIKTRLNL